MPGIPLEGRNKWITSHLEAGPPRAGVVRDHRTMPDFPKVQGSGQRMVLHRKSRTCPGYLVVSVDCRRVLFELHRQGGAGSWNLLVNASTASQIQSADAPYVLTAVRCRS